MTFQKLSTSTDGSGNVISSVNSSTTTLIANATFTGTFENVLQYQEVSVYSVSDVSGTLYLDISADGSTVLLSFPLVATTGSTFIRSALPESYARIRYVNGATPQTQFSLTTLYRPISGGIVQVPFSSTIFDVSLAGNQRAVIFSKDTNGNYNAIGMNLDGGLNVHVTDFPATQPISGTVTSNQGTPTSLANAWPVEVTDGTNILGTSTHPVRIDPTGTTTQPISGAVTVTQATGTNLHTVLDSGTLTSITNALPAGSNNIGSVNQGTSPWIVEDKADTTIASSVGTASGFAIGISGLYNTIQPAPTNGQQVELQTDQSGNLLSFPGVQTKAGAAWSSATAINTLQYPTGTTTIGAPLGGAVVMIQLNQTTTLTAGAVTFQGTYDNINWVTIPTSQIVAPSQPYASLTNPYTFVASTNQPFLIYAQGFQNIRLNLASVITGTGTVTPEWTLISNTITPISGSVSLGANLGKSVVMKTGTLVTTATTANQVILTYTVTTGKTLYLEYLEISAAQTVPSGGTNIVLGTINFQNPSGTNVISSRFVGGGADQMSEITIPFTEPIPVSSATVIQVVTTPAATTSMTWIANFGGYEK